MPLELSVGLVAGCQNGNIDQELVKGSRIARRLRVIHQPLPDRTRSSWFCPTGIALRMIQWHRSGGCRSWLQWNATGSIRFRRSERSKGSSIGQAGPDPERSGPGRRCRYCHSPKSGRFRVSGSKLTGSKTVISKAGSCSTRSKCAMLVPKASPPANIHVGRFSTLFGS